MSDKPFMAEKTIEEGDDGIRLDRWFKRHLPVVKHALLQKALRKGQVRLAGKKADANTRVEAGQALSFPNQWLWEKPEERPTQTIAKEVSKESIKELERCIIRENAQMIVLNKPAGLAVQGGTGQKESVDSIMRARAKLRNEEAPRLVHRIDRDTSGILVLAKTANDAAELAQAFARKTAEKRYWALVLGLPSHERGTINMPLAKHSKGKDSRVEKMMEDVEEGKEAITNYRIISKAGTKLTWVEMLPVTGRTHQLRVHMASIGHPILGDGKYGGAEAFLQGEEVPKKLHLHAAILSLPFGKKTLTFRAPLPKHMQKTWDYFGFEMNEADE